MLGEATNARQNTLQAGVIICSTDGNHKDQNQAVSPLNAGIQFSVTCLRLALPRVLNCQHQHFTKTTPKNEIVMKHEPFQALGHQVAKLHQLGAGPGPDLPYQNGQPGCQALDPIPNRRGVRGHLTAYFCLPTRVGQRSGPIF